MDYKKKYSKALAMDGSEPVTITKGDFDFLVALDGLIEHKVEIKVQESTVIPHIVVDSGKIKVDTFGKSRQNHSYFLFQRAGRSP